MNKNHNLDNFYYYAVAVLILLSAFSCSCSSKKHTHNSSCKEADVITIERSYAPKLIGHKVDGNRLYEEYSSDSTLEWEKIYVNGEIDSMTQWGNDGVLWFQTQYKDGLMHGTHTGYNHNGSGDVWYIHYYENGKCIREEEF